VPRVILLILAGSLAVAALLAVVTVPIARRIRPAVALRAE